MQEFGSLNLSALLQTVIYQYKSLEGAVFDTIEQYVWFSFPEWYRSAYMLSFFVAMVTGADTHTLHEEDELWGGFEQTQSWLIRMPSYLLFDFGVSVPFSIPLFGLAGLPYVACMTLYRRIWLKETGIRIHYLMHLNAICVMTVMVVLLLVVNKIALFVQ
jgi:hypothetical protein